MNLAHNHTFDRLKINNISIVRLSSILEIRIWKFRIEETAQMAISIVNFNFIRLWVINDIGTHLSEFTIYPPINSTFDWFCEGEKITLASSEFRENVGTLILNFDIHSGVECLDDESRSIFERDQTFQKIIKEAK